MSSTPSTRRAANLFDLRRIIGGLFVVYGVVLALLGLFASDEDVDRAAGVNINLWAGVGMLVFGLLMLAWALTRPLGDELVEGSGVDAPAPDSEQGSRAARGDDERPVGDGDPGRQ